jgi:hypothetical protein
MEAERQTTTLESKVSMRGGELVDWLVTSRGTTPDISSI